MGEAEQLLASIRPGDIIVADYHLATTHTGLDVLAIAGRNAGTDVTWHRVERRYAFGIEIHQDTGCQLALSQQVGGHQSIARGNQ